MTYFAVFTMFMAVTGFVAWGWVMGVQDAGGRLYVLKPLPTLLWAGAWLGLTLTEIGWL